MTRAAIAFIAGPAANLIRALRPNFLLRAASRSERALGPPKAPAPAINVSSGSFLAPAINRSRLSAADSVQAALKRSSSVRNQFLQARCLKIFFPIASSAVFQSASSPSFGKERTEVRVICFELPSPSPSPATGEGNAALGNLFRGNLNLLIQYVFTRNEPNDLILRGVSNDAQRIKTFLNRFDGFFIQAAQKNDSPVGVSQMFAGAVVDRTLAFLRDAILIAAGEPVNRLIPFVDAKLRLYQPLLGFIFHDFRDRFAID